MPENIKPEFNPMDVVRKLGKISPYREPEDGEEGKATLKTHYRVFNVSDAVDNKDLCEIKSKIYMKDLAHKEDTTFTKEGDWLVALSWYEMENTSSVV